MFSRIGTEYGEIESIISVDLSKAFDTIDYQPLIARLSAYKFSESSITLIKRYLTKRFQRTNVNYNFISWEKC